MRYFDIRGNPIDLQRIHTEHTRHKRTVCMW